MGGRPPPLPNTHIENSIKRFLYILKNLNSDVITFDFVSSENVVKLPKIAILSHTHKKMKLNLNTGPLIWTHTMKLIKLMMKMYYLTQK